MMMRASATASLVPAGVKGFEKAIGKLIDQKDEAIEDTVKRATIRAHKRAKTTKSGGARTWMTDAQIKQGFEAPRGNTSAMGYVPVDTGLLRASIRFQFKGEGANTVGLVFSDVDYAPMQENNRLFFEAGKQVAIDALNEDFDNAVDRAKSRAE